MQTQVMEASKQADPDKQPVDLLEECTKLLAQLTDAELAFHMGSGFQVKPAETQLLMFYRAVRCEPENTQHTDERCCNQLTADEIL
jgi:hypothetical protein